MSIGKSSSGSKAASKPASKPAAKSTPKTTSKPAVGKSTSTAPATSSSSKTSTVGAVGKSSSSSTSNSSKSTSSSSDSTGKTSSTAESKDSKSLDSASDAKTEDVDKADEVEEKDDGFEGTKELKGEKKEKKTAQERFNDKVIANIRKSYESNPSQISKDVSQLEQQLEVGKLDKVEAGRAVESLESRVAGLDGGKKDKLETRIQDLKKEVKEPEAGEKSQASIPKETPQERRSRVEAAEEKTRAQLQELRTRGDARTMGSLESAYQAAQQDKEKTVQTLERELSQFYSVDKAKELASRSLQSKDGFFSRYSALHQSSDATGKQNLSKLNPEAAELSSRLESKGLEAQGKARAKKEPEKQLEVAAKKVEEKGLVDKRELWAAEDQAHRRLQEYSKTGDQQALGEVTRAFGVAQANRGKTFEAFRSELSKVHTPQRAEELARHGIANKESFYTRYGSLYQSGGEKTRESLSQVNPTAAQLNERELAKARESAAPEVSDKKTGVENLKVEPERRATETETKTGKLEAELRETEREPSEKAPDGKLEHDAKVCTAADPEGTGEDPKSRVSDAQRRMESSQEEAKNRLSAYEKSGDKEALEKVEGAYQSALENRDETVAALEKELAKSYPAEQAKEMAERALDNKEEFYSRFSSLHETADEEGRKSLDSLNKPASELTAKERQSELTTAADLSKEEQAQNNVQAIQESFKERAVSSPETFEKQLKEAYPDASPEKLVELTELAKQGKFPVPDNVKFVGKYSLDLMLGGYSKKDGGTLYVSEELRHNPAALSQAISQGVVKHLDAKMGVNQGLLSTFDIDGKRDSHGAKLLGGVQSDVRRLTRDDVVAVRKASQQLRENPEARKQLEGVLTEHLKKNWGESVGPGKKPQDLARQAVESPKALGRLFTDAYKAGDPATRERLSQISPQLAKMAEAQLEAPKSSQALQVDQEAASRNYERYLDKGHEGPHLDPASKIAAGFERIQGEKNQETVGALQEMFEKRGLEPQEALRRAQEAAATEKGLYTQFSSLYHTADKVEKERLKALSPEMGDLLEREKAGTLQSDKEWRDGVRKSYENVPLLGGKLAERDIAKMESRLTGAATTDQKRDLANSFQQSIKKAATGDPEKFRSDLKAAFPKAKAETLDRLMELAKDGRFPLAEKVHFVEKGHKMLQGQNASYDDASEAIYIDKSLKDDPKAVLSAYVEENGHHLDKVLGGADTKGDEGELLEKSVLKEGGLSFLDKHRARIEDDRRIVIGEDGEITIIENQQGPIGVPGPITPGPVTPTPGPGGSTPPGGVISPGGPGGVGTPKPIPGGPNPLPGPSPLPAPTPTRPSPGSQAPSKLPTDSVSTPRSEPLPPRPGFDPVQVEAAKRAMESVENQAIRQRALQEAAELKSREDLLKLDEVVGKLKDLPGALRKLEKLQSALKDLGGLSNSLSDLESLNRTLGDLKGLSGDLESLKRLGKMQASLTELPAKLADGKRLPEALSTLADLSKNLGDVERLPQILERMKTLPQKLAQLEQLPKALVSFNKLPDNLSGLEKLSDLWGAAGHLAPKSQAKAGKSLASRGRAVAPRALSAKPPGGAEKLRSTVSPSKGQTSRAAASGQAPLGKGAPPSSKPISRSPWAGRLGGQTLQLGPSIGRDASRKTAPGGGAKKGLPLIDSPKGQSVSTPIPPKTDTELKQLPAKLESFGRQAEMMESLSKLRTLTDRDGKGLRSLPQLVENLSKLSGRVSAVTRLQSTLANRKELYRGLEGLSQLQQMAQKDPAKSGGYRELSGVLQALKDQPDASQGLKRMPGLMNLMGGVQGAVGAEQVDKLLRTLQQRPDALKGLKAFGTMMESLQARPETGRSLSQLSQLLGSGKVETLLEAGKKLSASLQNPQAVFGLDQLESLALKTRGNTALKAGMERMSKMPLGRQGADGLVRFGNLLGEVGRDARSVRGRVEQAMSRPSPAPVAPGLAARGTPARSQGMGPARGTEASRATPQAPNPAAPKTPASASNIIAESGIYSGPERRYSGPDRRQGDRRQDLAGVAGVGDRRQTGAGPAARTSPVQEVPKTSGPGRSRDFRKVFHLLREIGSAQPGSQRHSQTLAELSAKSEGAHAVADALEAGVVAEPKQTLSTLEQLTKTSESRKAFGKTLANVAESAPDRLVGIFLLTSDAEGGKQALTQLFSDLASAPESAESLGKTLSAASSSESSANGMKELFTGLLKPEGEKSARSEQTVRALAQASRSKAGARGVAQTFGNLMQAESGPRGVAELLRGMTQTQEGAKATTELLMNLSQDRQGARELGRVLSRAGKSEAGGRDILKSLAKIAKTQAGRNEVSRLLVRLSDEAGGAKLFSHLVRDKGNAKSFAGLLGQLSESPQAALNTRYALQKAMAHPQARREMELFRGRSSVEPSLREAVDKLTSAPLQSQPLQLSQSAKGADAMARLTAFENLARAVSEKPQQAPIRTVESAGGAASGHDTGGQSSGGESSQNQDQKAAWSQGAQPYPDLGTVSEVWRVQSVVRVEGSERLAEAAAGAASEGSQESQEASRNTAFRPGDVYSDLTLLRARICADCGFRTNSIGECSRCGFSLLDQ